MLKKNDFVEIEYTGWTKQDNIIFDTTDEKTAKDEGTHNPQASSVCNHRLPANRLVQRTIYHHLLPKSLAHHCVLFGIP